MDFSRIRVGVAIIGVALLVFCLASVQKLVEDVGPDEIAVIQSPVAGQLDWYSTPGLKWQGWGEVTTYKKRLTYAFEGRPGTNGMTGGIDVRFNEGGHGTIYGSIQCTMPSDVKMLTELHAGYRSQDQVLKNLIETVTNKSIYLVGTLMSSKESYAEKRNDLIHYVTDQVQNGVYRTRQKTEWVKDPVTNQDKQVTSAEIVMGRDGKPERQEEAILNKFGIHCYNFTINKLPYDPIVEKQIQQQQVIAMDIQTSIADLKKAEQRALTVEQQGKASATEAKWAQETIRAREVTKAEQQKQVDTIDAERQKVVAETQANQRLVVADLDRKAAEQTKLQNILLGEGEAARKKLVLDADGALEQKLAAYVSVTPKIFEALKGTAFVSQISMGGASGGQQTALPLIELLTAKTAKDLALDMSLPTSAPRPR